MSVGTRLRLEDAHKVAMRLMVYWGMPPGECLVAGSIRRGQPDVGDIDLVAPMPQSRSLGRLMPDALYEAIAASIDPAPDSEGSLFAAWPNTIGRAIEGVKPQFRGCSIRLRLKDGSEIPVQIGRYDPGADGNAGWISIIRTGPADFGRAFLVRWKRIHGIPQDQPASEGGYLVGPDRRPIPTPDEGHAFELCKWPFIQPAQREDAARAILRS
jgi:hypothetical protein